MAGADYRYELRRGEEVVATGHLGGEEPLEVGDRIEVGGRLAIVRTMSRCLGNPSYISSCGLWAM